MRVMLASGIVFAVMCIMLSGLPLFAAFIFAGVGAAVCVIFSVLKKPKFERLIVIGFLVFAASLLFVLKFYSVVAPAESLSGSVPFTATVKGEPEANSYGYTYMVKLRTVNGERVNSSAYIYASEGLGVETGDIISSVGKVSPIDNSLFYNAKNMNYSKGIFLKLEADYGIVIGQDRVDRAFGSLRKQLIKGINSTFSGEEGGLLRGIIVNDKNGVSDEVKAKLKAAGYSHLINVSGLHMSIVASFIYVLLYYVFKIKGKISLLITIILVIFYVFLTSFSVSAVRAGIMLIILHIGSLINKQSDSLNSLGLAVTSILMFNPYAIHDPSLSLSVLSTFGIIYSSEKIISLREEGKIRDKTEKVLMFLAPSFSAVVFSAPAAMVFFEEINVVSAVSNLFISFLITPLVLSGMVFSFLYISGFTIIAKLVGLITGVCLKGVLLSADIFSRIPFSIKTVTNASKFAVVVFVLLVFIIMAKNSKAKKTSASLGSVLLVVLVVFSAVETKGLKRDSVYILYDEESLVTVSKTDGEIYCFGVSGKTDVYNLSSLLRSLGIEEADLVYLDKSNAQAGTALRYLSENTSVKSVAAADDDIKVMAEKTVGVSASLIREVKKENIIFLSGKARVYFDGFYADVNIGSAENGVLKINNKSGKELSIYRSGIDKTGEIKYNKENDVGYISKGIYKVAEKGGKVRITEVKARVGDN